MNTLGKESKDAGVTHLHDGIKVKALDAEEKRLFEYDTPISFGHQDPALSQAPQNIERAFEEFDSDVMPLAQAGFKKAPQDPCTTIMIEPWMCRGHATFETVTES